MRRCLILDLKDDPVLIDRYRRWHEPGGPPAAVIQAIRAAGVQEMEIFLSGNRLVMVIDTPDDFSAEAWASANAENAAVQAWEALMSEFQQPVAWARPGEKWTSAEPIFTLSDQP